MNKCKLIAFDLDDTLLDGHGELASVTKEALEKGDKAGIEMVIASGRSYYSLPESLMNLSAIHYAICSNGATIFDMREKKCIHSYTMKKEAVRKILEIASDYRDDVYVDAFLEGRPHSEKRMLDEVDENPYITSHRKAYLKRTRVPEVDIFSFAKEHENNLDCMNYNVFDKSRFDELMERLKEVDDIYVTSSIESLIEISYEKSGKASGLKKLSELINIPLENITAYGNGDNDSDMLAVAGDGVAVENASDSCKEKANRIIGPNTENSVADDILKIVCLSCKE